MSDVVKRMSRAYWPRPELNESADKVAGDEAVDRLTLGELRDFFDRCKVGPTYCMVKRRFDDHLKQYFFRDIRSAALEASRASLRLVEEVRRTFETVNDLQTEG